MYSVLDFKADKDLVAGNHIYRKKMNDEKRTRAEVCRSAPPKKGVSWS